MRLMVIAALRAATIATMIHTICFHDGQPCQTKRAASSAPVRAKGSANTECSNLIISRTVRMRLLMGMRLCLGFFRGGRAGPAEHCVLRQIHLRQHSADVLRYKVVDVFRRVV